jgi:penicillin-binding protein 2
MIVRLRGVLALIVTVLVVFVARLMYLQFVMVDDLKIQSDQNVRIEARISPLRGRILARDGTVLADNRIAWDLMYRGGDVDHWDKLSYLLKLTDFPTDPDLSDPEQAAFGSVAAYNIPDDLVSAVEELVAGQAGVYLRERLERTYPTNLAAQVVGYTTEAKGRFEGYALSELVGVMGIEASYQKDLFGIPGAMDVQVDNHNTILHSQVTREALPGQDLTLTIDPKIQRMAEDVLKNALSYINGERDKRNLPHEDIVRGAIVAMNPKTGEILAMASTPTFDQNVFTKRPSDPDLVTALLTDNLNLPIQLLS